MQPAVPQIEHHRLSPRARNIFCLPTVGVSMHCTLEISSSNYRLGAEPLKSEAPVNREDNHI